MTMDRSSFPKGHIVNRDNFPQFKYEPDEIIFRPKRRTNLFRFKRISLDKKFKKDIKDGNTFQITEVDDFNTKGEKLRRGLQSPDFGRDPFSPDRKEFSCDCGYLIGARNEGKICPECKTATLHVTTDVSKAAYIDISPYKVLSYHGWYGMKRAVKKFDSIILDNKTKHTIDRSGNLITKGKYNMMELYDIYEDKFEEKTGVPIDIAFTSKVPVLNAQLRPAPRTGSKMTVFPINKTYKKMVKLQQDLELASMIKATNDLEVIRTLTEFQECMVELYDEFEKMIRGKNGLLKRYVIANRLDYNCRVVIAPGPLLKPHEVILPYQAILEMYEEEIISLIMKVKKVSMVKALDFFKRSRNKVKKSMLAIINIFLSTHEVWVMIDRNPTIKHGGILYMKVVDCHKKIENKTMLLPHSVLPGQGADFDGDQETAVAQKLPIDSVFSYHKLFKEIFCPTYMTINKATGRINRDMMPKKDKLAMIYEIYDISKMIQHVNNLDSKQLEDDSDPYVRKYNKIMNHVDPCPCEDERQWIEEYEEASSPLNIEGVLNQGSLDSMEDYDTLNEED